MAGGWQEDGSGAERTRRVRLAKHIGHRGNPVELVGSAVPDQFERCAQRRAFRAMHSRAFVRRSQHICCCALA